MSFIISIHTFLAEGDSVILYFIVQYANISIHTFLAEGDKFQVYFR